MNPTAAAGNSNQLEHANSQFQKLLPNKNLSKKRQLNQISGGHQDVDQRTTSKQSKILKRPKLNNDNDSKPLKSHLPMRQLHQISSQVNSKQKNPFGLNNLKDKAAQGSKKENLSSVFNSKLKITNSQEDKDVNGGEARLTKDRNPEQVNGSQENNSQQASAPHTQQPIKRNPLSFQEQLAKLRDQSSNYAQLSNDDLDRSISDSGIVLVQTGWQDPDPADSELNLMHEFVELEFEQHERRHASVDAENLRQYNLNITAVEPSNNVLDDAFLHEMSAPHENANCSRLELAHQPFVNLIKLDNKQRLSLHRRDNSV